MSIWSYLFGGKKEEEYTYFTNAKKPLGKNPEEDVDELIEELTVVEESLVGNNNSEPKDSNQKELPDEEQSEDLSFLFDDPVDVHVYQPESSETQTEENIRAESNRLLGEDLLDSLCDFGMEDTSQEATSQDELSGLFDDSEQSEDGLEVLFKEPVKEHSEIEKIIQFSNKIKELSQYGNFQAALSVIDNLPATYKKDALYSSVALAITQELGKETYTPQSKELLQEMLTKVKKLSSYLGEIKSEEEKNVQH